MSKKENINEIASMLYCCNDKEIESMVKIMRSMPHESRIGLLQEVFRMSRTNE